jgi:Asp-tRNA(Asn)/Glu-tRNA(Gln) amidotransferase A subunit family amidase
MVERLRKNGAILIGKTNVPEFGLGSHTYNPVFGTTFNAYDQSKSAGGSSGGAAVSLALNMLPVADGSDFGGSLRNPAAWNNVYGLQGHLSWESSIHRARKSFMTVFLLKVLWAEMFKILLCCYRYKQDMISVRLCL